MRKSKSEVKVNGKGEFTSPSKYIVRDGERKVIVMEYQNLLDPPKW